MDDDVSHKLNHLIIFLIILLFLVVIFAAVSIDKNAAIRKTAMEQEKSALGSDKTDDEEKIDETRTYEENSQVVDIVNEGEIIVSDEDGLNITREKEENKTEENRTEQLNLVQEKLNEEKQRQLKFLSIIDFEKVTLDNCDRYKVDVKQQREKAEYDITEKTKILKGYENDVVENEDKLAKATDDQNEEEIDKFTELLSNSKDDVKRVENEIRDMENFIIKARFTEEQLKVVCSN